MLVSSALGKVAPFVPVVGSAYGFGKTCINFNFLISVMPALGIVG